jgi:hypothetical protein
MIIQRYTEKSYVVIGTDTKVHKDELKIRGCKYNPKLTCGPGWIVSNHKYEEIKTYIDNFYDPSRPLTVAERLKSAQGTGAIAKKPALVPQVEEKVIPNPQPNGLPDGWTEEHFEKWMEQNSWAGYKDEPEQPLIEQVRHEEFGVPVEELLIEQVRHEEYDSSEVLIEQVRHEEFGVPVEELLLEQVKHEEQKVIASPEQQQVVATPVPPTPAANISERSSCKARRNVSLRRSPKPNRECCLHVKKDGTRCPTVPRGDKQYCGNHGRTKARQG